MSVFPRDCDTARESKRGLSKRGLGPKGAPKKAPFRGNFCSSPVAARRGEIGPSPGPKRPQTPKGPISQGRFPPIFSENLWLKLPFVSLPVLALDFSLSPKASHPKAGRSDFRNQQFEPDAGKTRKMWKVPLTQKNKGVRRFHGAKTWNAENADTKTRKCGRMRVTGFNVTGFK